MPVSKLRIAVLRGGPSDEFEVSLKTGENILSILRSLEDYEPEDIFISKDGTWHRRGIPIEPHDVLAHTDLAWNAMHGAYGEDGRVQQILDRYKVPYTGSGALASALAMQKDLAKEVYKKHSLRTPDWIVIEEGDDIDQKLGLAFRSFMFPVIIKPANSGSSIGVKIAHTFEDLKSTITSSLPKFKKLIVEQFVKGKDASCAVIENARGEKLYTFIPGPGKLSPEENKKIENFAKTTHQALGLRHYSESDFIISPRGNIYILETNALPVFTKNSSFTNALKSTGWQEPEFVKHVINLALK